VAVAKWRESSDINRMTLEQLKVFVAVAEREHVTRAAEALNLAQSAASAAIAALEGRHGTKLFHRVGRRIELTEAGRVFLPEAKAVLARAEAAELALAELGDLKRGVLHLAASQTIASYWLPRHLVSFRSDHPGIDIRLTIGNTSHALRAVYDGLVEIGFVEGAVDHPGLVSQPVARDRMVIVVAPGHPWARRGAISSDELCAADWVLREPGSGTRSALEQALLAQHITLDQLHVALELPSNEAVRAAVEAGMGATAISASVAAPSVEAGLLHLVGYTLPDRTFCAVRHAERQGSRAARALLAVLSP
jgi:DNA-binding transcriptional LysR family regulator